MMLDSDRCTSAVPYLDQAIEIAIGAGRCILEHRTNFHVADKGDHGADISPVTDADLAANSYIVEHLETLDPQIPIISEETAQVDYQTRKSWPRFWCVDPLDGTKGFIRGSDDFTVNIALVDHLEPILGVIYLPVKSQLFYAAKGFGAWKRDGAGPAVRIYSAIPDLRKGLTVVESSSHPTPELETYLRELPVAQRIPVSSSVKFCAVAEGRADIYPRMGPTMEWDVAAGDCIYRNSGRDGQRSTSLTYNKPSLKNGNFVIGFR